MKKIPLLKASDIEVKIKQVTGKGAIALLYKTARVDMALLDEVFGADNWECDYKVIKDNLYCGIGVRQDREQDFVWKWDCGTESREDGEGNQKKGEASDAFKRAGFKWGIGRELYTAPFIFLTVTTKEAGKTSKGKPIYELENRFEKFKCTDIEYNTDGKIDLVVISNDKGKVVFSTKRTTRIKKEEIKEIKVIEAVENTDILNDIYFYAEEAAKTEDEIQKWVKIRFKKDIKEITADEANELIKILQKLAKEGNAE